MMGERGWKPRHLLRLSDAGIDPEAVAEAIDKQGYHVIKGFFDTPLVDTLRQGCTALVDECAEELVADGLLTDRKASLPFEKRIAELYADHIDRAPLLFRTELHSRPEFYDLFFHPLLLDLMIALIGVDEIRLFPNYSCRPKMPFSTGHNVLWHQDCGLTHEGLPNEAPVEERLDAFGPNRLGWSVINCWTSLVPATPENGCMLFCPGSHKLGIQKHVAVKEYDQSKPKSDHGKYATQIDPAVMEEHKTSAIPIETQPGDLVLFNNLLFHSNQPNNSDHVRWSIDWRYQDASKPTHRPHKGHIARSLIDVDQEVQSAQEWTGLSLV